MPPPRPPGVITKASGMGPALQSQAPGSFPEHPSFPCEGCPPAQPPASPRGEGVIGDGGVSFSVPDVTLQLHLRQERQRSRACGRGWPAIQTMPLHDDDCIPGGTLGPGPARAAGPLEEL